MTEHNKLGAAEYLTVYNLWLHRTPTIIYWFNIVLKHLEKDHQSTTGKAEKEKSMIEHYHAVFIREEISPQKIGWDPLDGTGKN